MKKTVVIMLVMIICASLCGAFAAAWGKEKFLPVDKEIAVMSFNIRTIGLEDAPYKNWDARKSDVVALVKKYSPDIIGFQEPKDPQITYLKENLTEYEFYGKNGMGDSLLASLLGGTNAVFYKKDRFTLVSARTLWLSETPEVPSAGWDAPSSDYRTVTEVRLQDKLNHRIITYLNTHFAYLGQQAIANSSRMLANLAKDSVDPVIVSGDFNYEQKNLNYEIMVEGVLKDCRALAPDTDSGGTFHGFNGTVDKPWPTPIDFIFITDARLSAVSYKILRDANAEGRYPSDHFPIKAIIQYK